MKIPKVVELKQETSVADLLISLEGLVIVGRSLDDGLSRGKKTERKVVGPR